MSGAQWPRRWDPFRELQREVGRLFESFEPLHNWRLHRAFPAINLYDAGDRYVLTAELPGLTDRLLAAADDPEAGASRISYEPVQALTQALEAAAAR